MSWAAHLVNCWRDCPSSGRPAPLPPGCALKPSRRPSSAHLWSGWGLPGQGGAHHCLNDLDRAGPARSALPGRRLSGWQPSRSARAPRRRHCPCLDQLEASEPSSTMAARGFVVCRAAGGISDRAVAEGLRRERRAIGPALVRRRERPAKRAALIPYRKFSHHWKASPDTSTSSKNYRSDPTLWRSLVAARKLTA